MATEITVWFGFWLESCAARHCGETSQECQADQRSEVRGFCLFFLFLLLLFFLLLFFLLFFFLNILWRSLTSLLIFRGLWISSLLAWALTEPLGQAGLGLLVQSSYFSFHMASRFSALMTSQPPSYNFPM